MALIAAVLKELLACSDALLIGRDLLALLDLFLGLSLQAAEGLDVGNQVPHLVFLEDITPVGHAGSRHTIPDHPEDIGIKGEYFLPGRGLVFEHARCKVAGRRVQHILGGTVAGPFPSVTPGAPFLI